MAHTAFARAYRPQTFAEIIGQDRVSKTLASAVERGRIAQAYLFTGPRGTGKTSTARILAKALNCETGMTASPCGVCSTCEEIARSASFDVIEIDGASNRGIDNIRELRETVAFPPQKGRYKIFIIDEVHMLTNEAWNALLKTLEEPPAHVIFVFATTEPEKVLATIHSRCQRFDFRPIPVPEIVGQLARVAEKEKVPVEETALTMIAKSADGGMRDALTILDQAVAFASAKTGEAHTIGTVSEELVTELLGRVGSDAIESLVSQIETGDLKGIIATLDDVEDRGRSLTQLAHTLIEYYRERLLNEAGRPDGSPVPILRIIDELSGAIEKSRRSAHARLYLEVALFRATRAHERKIQLEMVLEKLSRLESAIAQGGGIPSAGEGSGSSSPSGESEKDPNADFFGGGMGGTNVAAKSARKADLIEKSVESVLKSKVETAPKKPAVTATKEEAPENNNTATVEPAKLQEEWPKLVEAVKAVSVTAAAVLIDAEIKSLSNDVLIVAFPGTFHRDKFDRDTTAKAAFLDAARNRWGQALRLKLQLLSSAVSETETPAVNTERAEEILKREPIVKAALDIFGGEIVEIKDAPSSGSGHRSH